MLHIPNKLKILLIVAFIFTGCKATYNITINDNKYINESLDIVEDDTSTFDKKNSLLYDVSPREYLNTNIQWPTPVYKDSEVNPIEPIEIDKVSYYDKKDISTSLKLGINYSFKHKQKEYINSNIVNTCYNYKYEVVDDKILFETIGNFKCFTEYPILDSVEITLNTNCKVINENSDNKIENNYIWNITKNDISKKIIFNLNCSKDKNEKEKKSANSIDLSSIKIIILCLFIIGFIIVIIRLINKRNNRL